MQLNNQMCTFCASANANPSPKQSTNRCDVPCEIGRYRWWARHNDPHRIYHWKMDEESHNRINSSSECITSNNNQIAFEFFAPHYIAVSNQCNRANAVTFTWAFVSSKHQNCPTASVLSVWTFKQRFGETTNPHILFGRRKINTRSFEEIKRNKPIRTMVWSN